MMLKSLVYGKPYNAIQNYSNLLMRNGGQLKAFSTSLTCSQGHATFCLIAAKVIPTGTRSCRLLISRLQQDRGISAALKPSKRLAAAPFSQLNVIRANAFTNRNSQAIWARSSEYIKSNSTSLKAIHGKPNMLSRLQEGSSPAPGIAQEPQFFRYRHTPWLLFGLCICLSAAAGSFVPRILIGSPPAFAEVRTNKAGRPTSSSSQSRSSESEASHGKKVYFDFHVTGVPGDGRCLFRAVAHGACLRSGRPPPDELTQRQMADDLRNYALDELVRRRETSEWFIEGDFDAYVRRMRLPHTWGGEPELLMLSNVLLTPITVYMKDKGGIIAIAEYGQEHSNDNPIRVLYHGFGHYEALRLPGDRQNIKEGFNLKSSLM